MNNYIKPGRTMTFTAPAAVASGAGVLIGSLLVVAANSAAAGQPFEGVTEGVFMLPKAAGAWTEGQLLYWDSAANNLVTATSATARRVGCAGAAAASGDSVGLVRLHGVPSVANVA
jgi:predicted RecA/RadA family phage recombinase